MNRPSSRQPLVVTVEAESHARVNEAFLRELWTYREVFRIPTWRAAEDTAEGKWPRLQPGHNHLRAELPRRLLDEGDYHLELMMGCHYRSWVGQPGHDAPSIRLSIQGGLSDSPLWLERRPGLLAPEVAWHNLSV